jgi:hypothetical protein
MSGRSKFWVYEPSELKYELLDPGIRDVVRFLIARGFHTTDSGDGESKRADGWDESTGLIPYPHVYMDVSPVSIVVACEHLIGCLRGVGINVVSQTEAWSEVIEKHGNDISGNDVRPKPYIEATYDPLGESAVIGLFHVTSDMIQEEMQRAYGEWEGKR